MQAKALLVTTVVALLALASCKSGHSKKSAPAARVDPASVQALAKAPSPPADATTSTEIGAGHASIDTDNGDDDADPSWIQELDIDGDGNAESVTLLWDDEDKVLYAYAETDVVCAYGGVVVAQVLIGVNAKGNPRQRAAGSGFYAVFLDRTECRSEGAGLYGAKFSPSGDITEAGAILLDEDEDDIWIVDPGYWVY